MPEAPECSRCGLFLTAGPAGAADLLVSKFHDPKSYTIILLRI
ncbi:9146_t:CDS:2 [Rhizophagus irregularis]|nr:9146_t:CDS:2 [Rhizophagus irregularis]